MVKHFIIWWPLHERYVKQSISCVGLTAQGQLLLKKRSEWWKTMFRPNEKIWKPIWKLCESTGFHESITFQRKKPPQVSSRRHAGGAFNVKQTHAALIAHCSKRESARLDSAQPSPTHYWWQFSPAGVSLRSEAAPCQLCTSSQSGEAAPGRRQLIGYGRRGGGGLPLMLPTLSTNTWEVKVKARNTIRSSERPE